MSTTRFASVLAALATALALAPVAHAQFKPFNFPKPESDFQFFAPADCDLYGGGPRPKTGWFATFDRAYVNVSRPRITYPTGTHAMGDFTWGNRFDVGYVDDDCSGWLVTGWHIDGPNEADEVRQERLNRFVEDASPGNAPAHPAADNNLRLTGDRDYILTNTLNVGDLTGIELNKTWMWKPLHHGGRLQPLAGFRYIKFIDFYQRQTYLRYDDDGIIVPIGPPADPTIGIGSLDATTEALFDTAAGVSNNMVGGQLGIRWDQEINRWNLSGDFKAMVFQNFQYFNRIDTATYNLYGGATPSGDSPDAITFQRSASSGHNSEFVAGFEVRTEAAYRVTRDFSVRLGFEFMDLMRGIGRGVDHQYNDQNLLLYGLTMGATYNR
ncbi:MAG: hypothetical protein FJ276_20130 [Planctomycetes bacterium]|nr:hypothetical protein [Planctomycetota bacterium]